MAALSGEGGSGEPGESGGGGPAAVAGSLRSDCPGGVGCGPPGISGAQRPVLDLGDTSCPGSEQTSHCWGARPGGVPRGDGGAAWPQGPAFGGRLGLGRTPRRALMVGGGEGRTT